MAVYSHDSSADFEVGFKEDYSEIIKDISPTTTPIVSMLGNETVESNNIETYTENLYARDGSVDIARAQGVKVADVTAKDEDLILMENNTQIYFEYTEASQNAIEVKQVGIENVLKHKAMRVLIHLKQCYDARIVTGVKKRKPKAGSSASYFQGMPGIIAQYGNVANGGTSYGANSENVDITIQNLASTSPDAQDSFDTLIRERWEDGGEPNMLICSGTNKVNVAAWDASGVTRNIDDPRKVIYNVEFYESPLGVPIAVVPHRALATHANGANDGFDAEGSGAVIKDFAILCDPKMWKTLTVQGDGWKRVNVPSTGRLFETYVTGQVSLRCYNPGGDALYSFAGFAGWSNTESLPTTSAGYDATT